MTVKILTGNRSVIQVYLDSNGYKSTDLPGYLDAKSAIFPDSTNYAVVVKKLPSLEDLVGHDVVILPDKVDKRSKAYKAAIALPFVKAIDYPTPSPWESAQIKALVLEIAHMLGVKLSSEMAQHVVSVASNNVAEIVCILQTCLYAKLDPTAVVSKSSYFVLDVPALYAERNLAKLEQALDYLQTTTHPLAFIAAIKSVFKLYLYILAGCDDQFFKEMRVHRYRVTLLKQQCLKLKVETFHKTYSEVLSLERQLKRGLSVESFWRKLFLVLSNG